MKSFFNRKTHTRGNGRELYFTPKPTIEKIVTDLIEYDKTLLNRTWIDVCAADGRWQDIITNKGIKCISYDISPLNDKVIQQDFFKMGKVKDSFIIGNPPFSLLKPFIYKALIISDMCYFLGGSQIITGRFSKKAKMVHRFVGYEGNQKDNRSKLAFMDTMNNQILVWCCGGLFVNRLYANLVHTNNLEQNTFRVSVQQYCKIDNRIRDILC